VRKIYKKFKSALARTFILLVSIVTYVFKYKRYNAVGLVKKGFEDHTAQIKINNGGYSQIFDRLIGAYHKSKEAQKEVERPYKISRMWQDMIDGQFADLVSALRAGDSTRLRSLLENFQRERFAFSSGGSASDYHSMRENRLFRYEFINAWYKYYNIYKDLIDERPRLSYPLIGNPAGMYYDEQIIPTESIRYQYYASEIKSLLCDLERPVICEIGGGLGGQAYKIISSLEHPATFILLDIPEMIVVSSYFLMAALPDKKVLLYGENTSDTGNPSQYDIIVLPHFALPQVQEQSVDLFFNSNSFSEMNSTSAKEYLRQIERSCRRYLMHINHNAEFVWNNNGEKTTNIRASDLIPDPNCFKRIYQHLRVFSKIDDRIFYYRKNVRHFAFLYERYC